MDMLKASQLLYGETNKEHRAKKAADWLESIDLRSGFELDSATIVKVERFRRSCVHALRAGINDPHFNKALRDVITLAKRRNAMNDTKIR